MAKLIVKHHGEAVITMELELGVEYIAGRSAEAQIQLPEERGISRQHLKFYERDGLWVCESLSKFVLIQKGRDLVQVLELEQSCIFTVTPFEFYFELPLQSSSSASEVDDQPVTPVPAPNLPAHFSPPPRPNISEQQHMGEHTSLRVNNEATMAGIAPNLVPYFRIAYPNTADDEVLKLEGHLWVAGRDPNCEIPIDSPHVSRKHFELARTYEGFFITDLGSSNGTKLNGVRIPPHEPTKVESGDELQVKNVDMTFEIRDSNFNHRVLSLPVPAFDPQMFAPAPALWYPQNDDQPTDLGREGGNFPALKDWKTIRPHHLKALGARKLILRGGILCAILLAVIIGSAPDKTKTPTERGPNSNNSVSFDKLTTEQRSVVKDSFSLARNLYVQGKYELCLTELAKLHDLIPQYENSKELQSFCEQGRELRHRQDDLERKERERAQIEAQISGIVDNCKDKLKEAGTVDETRSCLAAAIELDPEHHLIIEMIHTAQMHEEEKKFLANQRDQLAAKTAKGEAHFRRARALHKDGKLAKALSEYEHFVATPYPGTDGLKGEARRDIASIKQELKTKIDTLTDECKSLSAKGKFKEAYVSCEAAVAADPKNDAAKEVRDKMVAQLKHDLKGVYEDSVLEESMGNVDSAKEKWKKIIGDDLPSGEYAKKAKSKLDKYGAGD